MNSKNLIVALAFIICAVMYPINSASYRASDEAYNCVCSREYLPVCASDGFIYSNNCFFECQKVRDPYIEIEYDGDCYELSSLYD